MRAEYEQDGNMDLGGAQAFNALFVRQALTDGGLYLDHLAENENMVGGHQIIGVVSVPIDAHLHVVIPPAPADKQVVAAPLLIAETAVKLLVPGVGAVALRLHCGGKPWEGTVTGRRITGSGNDFYAVLTLAPDALPLRCTVSPADGVTHAVGNIAAALRLAIVQMKQWGLGSAVRWYLPGTVAVFDPGPGQL